MKHLLIEVAVGLAINYKMEDIVCMKKIYIYIIGLIFIILFLFLFMAFGKIKPDIEIISEQRGGIHNFYVENDKVYITGGLTIKNNTKNNIKYSIIGTSDDDFEIGLLKSKLLIGYDEKLETNMFEIGGKETQTFNVTLVGEYNGIYEKYDRLMPKLTIVY